MKQPASSESLVRAIGTFGLAASIINITIGGGIFRLPSAVATDLGAAAPLAYLVCAVAIGLIVLCIADAGKRVPLTGGPYAYIGSALGPYPAFLSGVLLWLVGLFATAAIATIFALGIGRLIPALSGRTMEVAVMAVSLGFWSIVNIGGVTIGNRLNSVATVAKLLPLLLLAVAGLFFIRPENLQWTTTPGAGDVLRTSLVLIFAFAGIEVALVPSGEVRDTARTVPRAVALAMTGITVIYILLQVVAQGILGAALAGSATPLADAARASLGGWAGALLLVGASISMFGYLGGMTLAMPRMVYAFARDGYLPRMFASTHPRTHVPVAAIVLQSILAFILAISGTFEKLAIIANISALILYLGCALAAWQLRGRRGLLPWITIALILGILSQAQLGEWMALAIAMVVASAVYAGVASSNQAGRLSKR